MSYQNVFKRYEMKYMLTRAQRDLLLQVMEPYMALDKFGHSSIRNIYFDTENYRLVRHSSSGPHTRRSCACAVTARPRQTGRYLWN